MYWIILFILILILVLAFKLRLVSGGGFNLLSLFRRPEKISNNNYEEVDVNLAKVKADPFYILNIENPSEAVQLAAVQQNGLILKTLHEHLKKSGMKLSESVQIAAVKAFRPIIRYIKENIGEPSDAVKAAALS